MKKSCLFLTLPVVATTLIPITSCTKSTGVEMKLTSDKEQQTSLLYVSFVFNFSQQVDKTHINFRIYNESKPEGGVTDATITLDGRDLYLTFAFNKYEYSTYSFDVEFNVDGVKNTFTGLTVTLIPATNVIPDDALIINDGVLEGLDPEFELYDFYDTLQIPSTVTTIKADAFKDVFTKTLNPNITTIILNKQLTSIESNAFAGCNAITTLDVSNVPVLDDEAPIAIGTDAFADWAISGTIKYLNNATYYNLLDYQLCDAGLNKAWFNAAYRPTPESDFSMPNIYTVDGFAWNSTNSVPRHMTELINILQLPELTTVISDDAFYDEDTDESLIPSNVKLLRLPDTLRTIGDNVFRKAPIIYNSTTLGYFELPFALTSIGKYAFAGSNIINVKFCSSVESIGDYAFYGCQSLETIDTTSLKTVPTDWSKTSTFSQLSSSGTFEVVPSTASSWETYYQNFDFNFTNWKFTNQIDLLSSSYVPAYAPLTPSEEFTQEGAAAKLRNEYNTKSPVIIDDIAYTLLDGEKAGYHEFKINFSKVSLDNTGYLTLTINYTARTFDDVTWRGSWTLFNIPLNTIDKVEVDQTTKVMTFNFKNLFDGDPSFIYIKETPSTTGEERVAAISNADLLTKENLGDRLYNLGLFNIPESGEKTLKIASRYLGECTLSD